MENTRRFLHIEEVPEGVPCLVFSDPDVIALAPEEAETLKVANDLEMLSFAEREIVQRVPKYKPVVDRWTRMLDEGRK